MEKELLPPLEPGKASHDEHFYKMHSPNDDNNKETDSYCNAEVPQDIDDECNYKVSNHPSSHEEGNYSNHQNTCTLSSSTNFPNNSPQLPSSKAVKYKRKRRKGKCKKRFMEDILAVARHSTLEEIDGVKKFYYAETVVAEGCQQEVPCQNISIAADSCRKGGSEDDGVANGDVTPKGPLVLNFRLNGCNVIGN